MNEQAARQPWFKEWFNSPFYYKLYLGRNKEEANAFIPKLIQYLKPALRSRILDLGCGDGEAGRILSSMGFDVTGVDISPDNIDHARKSESEQLHFFIHDIRLPFWINYFDYAFNFFTGFGYFNTRREHDDAIRTISGSLKPGGIFVIDYINCHYIEKHISYSETKQIGSTRYNIHRWDDSTHFYKRIEIIDDLLNEPLSFTEKIAKYSLGDFTDMLSFQSLQIQEVFGDHHLNEFHVKDSPRLIIIARKKNNEPSDKKKRLYSDGRATDALI